MTGQGRATWLRVGIAALNLLAPGLGLLRLGRLGAALFFLLAFPLLLLVMSALFARFPELGFVAWAAIVGAAIILQLAICFVPMAIGWRRSRNRECRPAWWTRWYGLGGAWLLWMGAVLATPDLRSHYRTFYLPSSAMAPTLVKNDRLVASMRVGPLRRGDIILFNLGDQIYVKRVAGLPGDRIALVDGIVILNGQPVPQRAVRIESLRTGTYGSPVRRLQEQFPGEAAPHEIYDGGVSPGDNFAEQLVGPEHVFVLGDNRDESADSRYSRDVYGVEQLAVGDIIGRPLFYLWGPSRRLGERLHRRPH